LRTSHLAIQRKIDDEKSKLTDEQIFGSRAFEAYLADIAEAVSKRYKRKLRVKVLWDTSHGSVTAYTDNSKIVINSGNYIPMSYPTRKSKYFSIMGFLGHELGHVLFTDFILSKTHTASLVNKNKFYPKEPSELSALDKLNLEIINEYLREEKPEVGKLIIIRIIADLSNILEDVYVELRMCDAFKGKLKRGIRLNNSRISDIAEPITVQIDKGYEDISIMKNIILQYCRTGDFNNRDNYVGEYIDVFNECIPLIDESIYVDDIKIRLDAANTLLVKLWTFVKKLIDRAEEMQVENPSLSAQDIVNILFDELSDEVIESEISPAPAGRTKGSVSSSPYNFTGEDEDSSDDSDDEVQEVSETETGRLKLEKTDEIFEDDSDGTTTYDNNYSGTGKDYSDDMLRILQQVAEEKVRVDLEQELTEELQKEADKVRYGNAHEGISVKIKRMAYVDSSLESAYKNCSAQLLNISKKLQSQILQKVKDKKDGGKISGLIYGKRLNSRSLMNKDGKYFYNNKLPEDSLDIAIGLLIDKSGSMCSNDRITHARAASIILYDFATSIDVPICVYGHTETFRDVELFSYCEFDSYDNKDKFRLMDMSARDNNRDGAAIRYVAEHLLKRSEQHKILILISDGQPAAKGYYGTEAEADLRGIKLKYERKGIHMFNASIGDDKENLERIYKSGFLDVTDLNKLPLLLTNLIVKYIN